jgi:LysM domain
MMEVDMVAMVSDMPVSAMEDEHPTLGDAVIRTEITRFAPRAPRPVPSADRLAAPPAVRLTPRGRIVVTAASAVLIGALSVLLATAAQAAHSGPATPGRYVTRVAVEPGQSLWSLAEAYDPDSDPRVIAARIQQLNSLPGDEIQPGEMLWVPRG